MPTDTPPSTNHDQPDRASISGKASIPQTAASESRLVLRWRVAFLVLCTAGALLSADLIRLHVRVHTDPDYHSYCAISEWANCETVAASDYAVVMGLPVAIWGLLGFLAMGVLAVWGLRRPLTPPSWPYGLLFWLSAFSSIILTVLLFVSHFIIESICVVCMGAWAVSLSLLATATAELIRLKTRPLSALATDLKAVLARPVAPVVTGGVFCAILAILQVFVPPYWRTEQTMGPGGLAVGVTAEGHAWIGARNPVLTITEFSDYQCPYCKRGHEEIRELLRANPDKIRLVHRHFPLDRSCNSQLNRPFHPYACSYARLAYCAQKADRFWEANDLLYKKGRRRELFATWELAAALKIRKGSLSVCERSPEAAAAVKSDLEAGQALKIRGTPTFVIGDRTYPGFVPPEVLDAALAR